MNFVMITDSTSLSIHHAVFDYSPITACPQVFYFLHNKDIYMNHLHSFLTETALLCKLCESAEDRYCEKTEEKKANLIKPTAHDWGLETRL